MNCQQARNFFDAYLDGELSPSLETELAAHRLQCSDCRHELALLEVVGHVVSADGETEATLGDAFGDRLLDCLRERRSPEPRGILFRSWVWAGASLAAAACLALVWALFLNGPAPQVAGEKHVNPAAAVHLEEAADSIVHEFRTTWTRRIHNANQVIEFGEMTLMQMLDRLGIDEAVEQAKPFQVMPDSFDELLPGRADDGIEDL